MQTLEAKVEETISFDVVIPRDDILYKFSTELLKLEVLLKAGENVKLAGTLSIDLSKYLNMSVLASDFETFPLQDSPDKKAEVLLSIALDKIQEGVPVDDSLMEGSRTGKDNSYSRFENSRSRSHSRTNVILKKKDPLQIFDEPQMTTTTTPGTSMNVQDARDMLFKDVPEEGSLPFDRILRTRPSPNNSRSIERPRGNIKITHTPKSTTEILPQAPPQQPITQPYHPTSSTAILSPQQQPKPSPISTAIHQNISIGNSGQIMNSQHSFQSGQQMVGKRSLGGEFAGSGGGMVGGSAVPQQVAQPYRASLLTSPDSFPRETFGPGGSAPSNTNNHQKELLNMQLRAEQAEEKLKQLQLTNSSISNENSALLAKINDLQATQQQLQADRATLQQSNSSLQQELNKSSSAIERLDKEKLTIANELSTFKSEAQRQIQDKDHSLKQLLSQITQLKNDLTQKSSHCDSLQQQVSLLHSQLVSAQSKQPQPQMAQSDLDQQLDKQGFLDLSDSDEGDAFDFNQTLKAEYEQRIHDLTSELQETKEALQNKITAKEVTDANLKRIVGLLNKITAEKKQLIEANELLSAQLEKYK